MSVQNGLCCQGASGEKSQEAVPGIQVRHHRPAGPLQTESDTADMADLVESSGMHRASRTGRTTATHLPTSTSCPGGNRGAVGLGTARGHPRTSGRSHLRLRPLHQEETFWQPRTTSRPSPACCVLLQIKFCWNTVCSSTCLRPRCSAAAQLGICSRDHIVHRA